MGTADRRWIRASTLGDLLGERAAEQGDREALAFPTERATYRELAQRAEQLGRGLLGLGVRPGDRVGFLLPNSVDSVAALFGAALIGAVPVPVNARFKSVELAQVITHSGMRVLLTCPRQDPDAPDFVALLEETFPELAARPGAALGELEHVVTLGGEAGWPTSEADFLDAAQRIDPAEVARLAGLVRVRDTAVIMYTSGTTAAPKGAMISHEAFTRFAAGTVHDRLGLTPDDRVWAAVPLFHIGGIGFAVATLYAGATFAHAGQFQPNTALRHIERERVTVSLAAFETIWLAVLDAPDFAERDLGSIRIVMAVGVPERLRGMSARLPHATQISCFGQTEATAFLSLNSLHDSLEQRVTTGGHPLPGMQCRIVDPATGIDVPAGTQGELLHRGSNCFDGYFREPELTERSFDADGWFHTGDVATLDTDGRVTFISRLKDMLKVGGENVSAAEVEDYLLRHPAVGIVAVVAAPDSYYVEVPAAFVELAPGASATEQELIDFCVGRIATYRVPRYVRFVTEWPMSGTKIKKYELRRMIADELAERGVTSAPKIHPAAGSPGSRDASG